MYFLFKCCENFLLENNCKLGGKLEEWCTPQRMSFLTELFARGRIQLRAVCTQGSGLHFYRRLYVYERLMCKLSPRAFHLETGLPSLAMTCADHQGAAENQGGPPPAAGEKPEALISLITARPGGPADLHGL